MPALVLLADFWEPYIFILFLLGTNWQSQFLCLSGCPSASSKKEGSLSQNPGTFPDLLGGWQEFEVGPRRTSHPRPAPQWSPPAALTKDSAFSVTGPY